MQRGMKKAKTPKQVRQEKRASKGLAAAVAQIVGIGLVAGAALVVGTDRVMKKIFKDQEHQEAEAAQENREAKDSQESQEPQEFRDFDRADYQVDDLADDAPER